MEWLIFGIIIFLTVINVPIAFALALTTILVLLWTGTASLSVVPLNLFSGAASFPLLAIPLFILAGGLMETSGISLRLVNLANSLVGFIRGGLAMITVVATMIQSEISSDSKDPRAPAGIVDLRDRTASDSQEYLLRQVAGRIAVAEKPAQVSEDPITMSGEQHVGIGHRVQLSPI